MWINKRNGEKRTGKIQKERSKIKNLVKNYRKTKKIFFFLITKKERSRKGEINFENENKIKILILKKKKKENKIRSKNRLLRNSCEEVSNNNVQQEIFCYITTVYYVAWGRR